jgi:hypothetical protein
VTLRIGSSVVHRRSGAEFRTIGATIGSESLKRSRSSVMVRVYLRLTLLCVLAVELLILGYVLHRRRSLVDRPQIDPHALQEIEKAKRR